MREKACVALLQTPCGRTVAAAVSIACYLPLVPGHLQKPIKEHTNAQASSCCNLLDVCSNNLQVLRQLKRQEHRGIKQLLAILMLPPLSPSLLNQGHL